MSRHAFLLALSVVISASPAWSIPIYSISDFQPAGVTNTGTVYGQDQGLGGNVASVVDPDGMVTNVPGASSSSFAVDMRQDDSAIVYQDGNEAFHFEIGVGTATLIPGFADTPSVRSVSVTGISNDNAMSGFAAHVLLAEGFTYGVGDSLPTGIGFLNPMLPSSQGFDIALDSNTVVGSSADSSLPNGRGFFYDSGVMNAVFTPSGIDRSTSVTVVNADGTIGAGIGRDALGNQNIVVWAGGGTTGFVVPNVLGGTIATVLSINGAGTVVTASCNTGWATHLCYLVDKSSVEYLAGQSIFGGAAVETDLGNGWVIRDGHAELALLGDVLAGQTIEGGYISPDSLHLVGDISGSQITSLWATAVPEPSTALLVGLGLAVVAWRQRVH